MSRAISSTQLRKRATVFAALGDETRRMLVKELSRGGTALSLLGNLPPI